MKVAPLGLLGLLMVACGGPPPPDADAPKAETPKYSYKGTWKEETTTLPTTYIFDDSTWRAQQTIDGKVVEISGTYFVSGSNLVFTRKDASSTQVSSNRQTQNFAVRADWVDGKHFALVGSDGARKFAKQD